MKTVSITIYKRTVCTSLGNARQRFRRALCLTKSHEDDVTFYQTNSFYQASSSHARQPFPSSESQNYMNILTNEELVPALLMGHSFFIALGIFQNAQN